MLSFSFFHKIEEIRYSTTSCDDVIRDYLIILDMLLCNQEVILTLLKACIDLKTNSNTKIYFSYFNNIIDFSTQQHTCEAYVLFWYNHGNKILQF